jgi:hypothetical protein
VRPRRRFDRIIRVRVKRKRSIVGDFDLVFPRDGQLDDDTQDREKENRAGDYRAKTKAARARVL